MRLILLSIWIIFCALRCIAGDEVTMSGPYDPTVRTVMIRPVDPSGAVYEGPAVMTLGAADGVQIDFDILADDKTDLRYELIPCDALWRPSGLVDPEFLDGFNQADVNDWEFSSATLIHYVHYRIRVPDSQLSPTLPGNYLLRVYPQDDPDHTLLKARFGVTDNSAPATAEVTSRTDFDVNGAHQQLSVSVDTRHLGVIDPYSDIRLVVEQDSRTDNASTITHPLRLKGTTAIFEHAPELTFPAGKEYRRFEIIAETLPGMGVEDITFVDPFYHQTLYADLPRAGEPYGYDLSRQGRSLIRRQGSADPDTEADYQLVHFTLLSPRLPDKDVYIEGELTDRRLSTDALMGFDEKSGAYHATLLLKQGAHSYQYIAVPKDQQLRKSSHTETIEGDDYRTAHTYTISVYYRRPGERFDRLGSVITLTTKP